MAFFGRKIFAHCEIFTRFHFDPRCLRAKYVKEYDLEDDQIVSLPCQTEAEDRHEAEARTRDGANEFREGARHMDT